MTSKKHILTILLLTLSICFSGCDESTIKIKGFLKTLDKNAPPLNDQSSFSNNFITGYDSRNRFFYWNNGEIYFPGDPLNITNYSFNFPSFANGQWSKNYNYAISNGTIFLKGSDNNGKKYFWKNLVRHDYSMEDKASGKQFTQIETDGHLNTIGENLYTTGTASDGVTTVPVYWKNEELFPIQLSKNGEDFTSYSFLHIHKYGGARVINGDDFYIFGIASSNNHSGLVYWKNGEIFKLVNNSLDYVNVQDVQFVNNDIYIFAVGSENISGNASQIFTYWKNDVAVMPSDLYSNISILSSYDGTFSIYEDNVYIVGTIYRNSEELPAFWKNGEEHLLPTTANSSNNILTQFTITSTKILNGDHFIFGSAYMQNNNGGIRVPVIWKNGNLNVSSPKDSNGEDLSFSDTLVMGYSASVYFYQNDYYWVGSFFNTNDGLRYYGYYKNEQLILLPSYNFQINQQTPATLKGSDFYIFGSLNDSNLSKDILAYWKNGTLKTPTMTDDFGDEAFLYSISNVNYRFNPNGDLFICAHVYINNRGGAEYAAYWLNDNLHLLNKPTGGFQVIGVCE